MNTIIKTFLFSSLICLTGCSSMTGQYPTAQTYRNSTPLAEQTARIPPAKANPVVPQTFPLETIQTEPIQTAPQKNADVPKIVRLPPVENAAAQLAANNPGKTPEEGKTTIITPKELFVDKATEPIAAVTAVNTANAANAASLTELNISDLDKIFDSQVQQSSYLEPATETTETIKSAESAKAAESVETIKTTDTPQSNAATNANWERATDQANAVGAISEKNNSSENVEPVKPTEPAEPSESASSENQIVLPVLDSAIVSAAPAALQVHSLAFVTSIRGRGDCTQLVKPYRFTAGETVLMYSEVDMPQAGLKLKSGYELKSSDGTVVRSQSDACAAPAGETGFYQSLMFKLPDNITPGAYTVTVWVQDLTTNSQSESSIELEIAP